MTAQEELVLEARIAALENVPLTLPVAPDPAYGTQLWVQPAAGDSIASFGARVRRIVAILQYAGDPYAQAKRAVFLAYPPTPMRAGARTLVPPSWANEGVDPAALALPPGGDTITFQPASTETEWSTGTKVAVGVGAAVAVGLAGYLLFRRPRRSRR